MPVAPGKKMGSWQRGDAANFAAFQNAIRDVLKEQELGSTWFVEVEVKRVGNPIHEYRIVLSPS